MSPLRVVLRMLPILCVAGAAGFALGRVDARAPEPGDAEVFPRFDWTDTTKYVHWYPTVHLLDQDLGSMPIAGGTWPSHEGQAGQSWEPLESACPNSKLYSGMWVLLPDSRVFLPDTGAAPGTDLSPSSPVAGR